MGLYDHIYPTEAEKKLIDAAARGEWCDLTDGEGLTTDAAKGDTWGPERTIRAEVIIALAINARSAWPIASKGIRLVGANISGDLDFEGTTAEHFLLLISCYVANPIILRRSRIRTFIILKSCLRPASGRAIGRV